MKGQKYTNIKQEFYRKTVESVFVLLLLIVAVIFTYNGLNPKKTKSYFELTDTLVGEINVADVPLLVMQDVGAGYVNVTTTGFDLGTDYYTTDKSYDYDLIIKNNEANTVTENYYLRWRFIATIDGVDHNINNLCATTDLSKVRSIGDYIYLVNNNASAFLAGQTNVKILSNINFVGSYNADTDEWESLLDIYNSGSEFRLRVEIDGSVAPWDLSTPRVNFYSGNELIGSSELTDQNTIFIPRNTPAPSSGGNYFQGWIADGNNATIYTPNEEIPYNSSAVYTPYYAPDASYPDLTFSLISGTRQFQVFGNNSTATTITVPPLFQGCLVSKVGSRAFYSYTSLTTLNLPETITELGERAVYNTKITSIDLYEGLRTIGLNVFSWSKLVEVNLPSTITTMGTNPFYAISTLTTINIDSNNRYFKLEDQVLLSRDGTKLIACIPSKTGNYIIPSTVTAVDSGAFAFSHIGVLAVSKNVVSMTAVMYSSIVSIDVDADNNYYSSLDGVLYNKAKTQIISCPAGLTGTVTIPSSVNLIWSYAFYQTSLSGITFENTSGWFVSTSSSATSGTNVVISDPATNKNNLRTTYPSYYWKRR